MNFSNFRFDNSTSSLLILTGLFIVFLVLLTFVYLFVFKRLSKFVSKTETNIDDIILRLLKIPALWMLYWGCLKIFSHIFLTNTSFFRLLAHINNILLILSAAWLLTKVVKIGSYFLQNKLDIKNEDNLRGRKLLTQLKVFEGIADTIIVIMAVSFSLMTFSQARAIGASLLTSAGIAGILVGLAAQKSISMILAGIQIAITQPIRLDDVVIVEGEWGRIEEITLTYVVVKIWDERRLIIPINYFLEKTFQNWTRTGSNILGTVFLQVGYDLPVDKMRDELDRLVTGNPNWDGRCANIQVTNTNQYGKEVRLLVSSSDSSRNWDLRVELREKMLDFIQHNYPHCFVKYQIEMNRTPDLVKA